MLKSYSQYGQDVLAEALMLRHKLIPSVKDYKGFYVDAGCCWPINSSNTYHFYNRGWRGVCIDANPEMAELFEQNRPDDLFVNGGLGLGGDPLEFYFYENRQHNSFDKARYESKKKNCIGKKTIEIKGLSQILIEADRAEQSIDLISMDVEGFEMDVLKSIDFEKHGPSMFIIEAITPIEKVTAFEPVSFVIKQGYKLIAHTGHDAFLIKPRAAA